MQINRASTFFKPKKERVLLRPFFPTNDTRARKIIRRILHLPSDAVEREIEEIHSSFAERHRHLHDFFLKRYQDLSDYIPRGELPDNDRKQLIGAFFSMEYAVEAAALFNPSMVWHPDQSGLKPGDRRFIVSLRATGEGHISSITFRSGIIGKQNQITPDDTSRFCNTPQIFREKDGYKAHFNEEYSLDERLLFPVLPTESNGLEDARFVQFQNQNGTSRYLATYTAYDGKNIRTRLLETDNFMQFKIRTLTGNAIANKGMALFPRQVHDSYVMLSRQDNENNYIMFSDNLTRWEYKQRLTEPIYPWEFFQIGNCGSPVETDKGWLVLAHAVGAMRKYVLSAYLLDLNDPSKVIGRLKTPLMEANTEEREGYVPNVVYSCGAVVHNDTLVVPYAMSDMYSGFALLPLDALLRELAINA